MTKAQKENQARFKKVQAEAKKLKAKNPKLAHTEAVKRAWAIILPKSAKKKPAAKKVGAVKKKVAAKKKPTTKKAAVKKQTGKTKIAIDKKLQAKLVGKRLSKSGKVYYEARANRSDKGRLLGVKKKPAVSKHKDTQSHNVSIRVMSGVKKSVQPDIINSIEKTIRSRDYYLYVNIPYWEKEYKIQSSPSLKKNAKTNIALNKKYIKELNTHIKELKKLI